jgi:hypothetical protein
MNISFIENWFYENQIFDILENKINLEPIYLRFSRSIADVSVLSNDKTELLKNEEYRNSVCKNLKKEQIQFILSKFVDENKQSINLNINLNNITNNNNSKNIKKDTSNTSTNKNKQQTTKTNTTNQNNKTSTPKKPANDLKKQTTPTTTTTTTKQTNTTPIKQNDEKNKKLNDPSVDMSPKKQDSSNDNVPNDLLLNVNINFQRFVFGKKLIESPLFHFEKNDFEKDIEQILKDIKIDIEDIKHYKQFKFLI